MNGKSPSSRLGTFLTLPRHRPARAAKLAEPSAHVDVAPQHTYRHRWWWRGVIVVVLAILSVAGFHSGQFLYHEMASSTIQARYFSELSSQLSFALEPGPSALTRYPTTGPYDRRFGYVALPGFLQHLRALGFDITAQAHISPQFAQVVDKGFFPIYHEKTQAGLHLLDQRGQTVFRATSPLRVYDNFEDIPPLVLNTLLFIENRDLFDARYPQRNPAVEWSRFGRALLDTLVRTLGFNASRAGGSTLATQLEKFRHSPDGRTVSGLEKLRQMGSASLRAYLDGPDTVQARRAIALAYINALPLAAIAGYGEVHGLGDGLWVWYSADFATINRLLRDPLTASQTVSAEHAMAYRQVLCLLLAQRRPAFYLGDGYASLQTLADSYLRLMATQGVIPPAWRDATLHVQVPLHPPPVVVDNRPFASQKTTSVIRARLAHDLGVTNLYDLDHFDLSVVSTLDQAVQQAVTEALHNLRTRQQAQAAGLYGEHLLGDRDNLNRVVYSFTLYERSPQGHRLRVQTDNYDQPLDINEGIRLDLGSTAKLRTLVHYLELIAEIYQRYTGQSPQALRALDIDKRDTLSRWVVERLSRTPQLRLPELLEAALERRYSASPGEAFLTGGGVHTFANFNDTDDAKILSVRQAFRDSVNLVFIRLMRDIVYHYLYRVGATAIQIAAGDDLQRQAYLERFADREGRTFLRRFYAKYRGKAPQEALALVTQNAQAYPARLAIIYRSVYPDHDFAVFKAYLRAHPATRDLTELDISELYDSNAPERFDLHDRSYMAHLHPLELWLLGYLAHHPHASLQEVMGASSNERQSVYRWLFKTGRKYAQDKRIQTLLEIEAFTEIHQVWQRLGYPFETLTPSYASAVGASGDRPAALAALIGVLLNDGVQAPRLRFERYHFAAGTPYETLLTRPPVRGERLLAPEVAAAARGALIDVVEAGTARRLKGVYQRPGQPPLRVGGKTGTGDHRRTSHGAHGQLIGTQVVSRAATFAFFLGDRFFGVVTAYVTGPEAARYQFTSALPVQVLKSLAPILMPFIERAPPEQAPLPVVSQR